MTVFILYEVFRVPVTVIIKDGRKFVDEITLEYPVFVYKSNYFPRSVVYSIVDGGYIYTDYFYLKHIDKDKFDKLNEYKYDSKDYTYVIKSKDIKCRKDELYSGLREIVRKIIFKDVLRLNRYTIKQIYDAWGYGVYRIRKNISLIIAEPAEEILVTSEDSKEHEKLVLYEVLEWEKNDLIFAGYFGTTVRCKCGKEFSFSIFKEKGTTKCPNWEFNIFDSLDTLKKKIIDSSFAL